MDESVILITSVSTKVLLVKEFKKAFLEENVKGRVIGIDINPLSAALYFCDEYKICPRLDDPGYLSFIENICTEKKVNVIVPTRDEDVLYLAANKKYLENKTATKVMTPDIEVANICSDKYEFFKFLQKHNLPTITSWIDISEEITYPCILKSRIGAGARKFCIVENADDLSEILTEFNNPIIQEYVEGTEYSIDYFADFEMKCLSVVPRIRMKVISGESKVGMTISDQEISNLCVELGSKLNLIGHNVIQCFRTDSGEIKFIEVNARFGGASNLSFAAGRRTPLYLVKLLNKNPIEITPFKEKLVMLRYSEDLFIDAP